MSTKKASDSQLRFLRWITLYYNWNYSDTVMDLIRTTITNGFYYECDIDVLNHIRENLIVKYNRDEMKRTINRKPDK